MGDHADHDDDHDRGLAFDLPRLLDRRGALRLLAGAWVTTLVACESDSGGPPSTPSAPGAPGATQGTGTTAGGDTVGTGSGTCDEIPEETAGPFPGDGSNGPNALTESGVVRRDITPSFAGAAGTAEGVPLAVNLTVLDGSSGCRALAGAAVYVWHCDRGGRYSLYSQGATDANYLRGVQETDADGRVTFASIFPGAYAGRWPHIHFEVYRSLGEATSAGIRLATSQLALPEDACDLVYATDGYEESVQNLARTSLERDNVFGDGFDDQLATVGGDVRSGFTASLTVVV